MTHPTASSRLNILLLEDDEDDKMFFEDAVASLKIPHQVICAKDCFRFFNVLDANKRFDLIFIDINIPLITGRECLKEIKRNEKYKNIPVIMFTGSSAQKEIDETYRNGAHYYIVKPHRQSGYVTYLKTIFGINWKKSQPRPSKENFVLNF